MAKLSIVALVLFLTSCKGCDESDGSLTRICPDQVHPSHSFEDSEDKDSDGFAICALDCNDNDSTVHPNALEICNNVDDNCNGNIDEDVTFPCWIGNDLNVAVEAPAICRVGRLNCSAGVWGACESQISPGVEICNNLDDDCDGEVDEPAPNGCGPSIEVGVCLKGTQLCAEDETYCVGAVFPQTESCNALDDDCDGFVDEQLDQRCSTACGFGIETCDRGEWKNCNAPKPEAEFCDGLDNDCNGLSDDGIVCRCTWSEDPTQRDVTFCTGGNLTCGLGISECLMDGTWGICQPYASMDEKCNGWDDDCDGNVDGITEDCGDPLFAGHGVCQLGTATCSAGQWSDCDGAVSPTEEICNSLDDDCDDMVDENLNPHSQVDIWFVIDGSGSMCPRVEALRNGLALYANDFRNTFHRFGFGVFPGSSDNVDVITPPVGIDAFLLALLSYNCNYGGLEPGWSAAWLSMSAADPLGIGWALPDAAAGTEGAYPYIVFIGDESADQQAPGYALPLGIPTTEMHVSTQAYDCRVGACIQGDKFELFVITVPSYFLQWDSPTFFETERIVEIDPATPDRYADILRGFLKNVCR